MLQSDIFYKLISKALVEHYELYSTNLTEIYLYKSK